MNKIYLIKSGVMLDAVKSYISDMQNCLSEYSDFSKLFGATAYFKTRRKLYGLQLKNAPDGWTKPTRKNGETHPKKSCKDSEMINALPEIPDQVSIIKEITGVPLVLQYTNESRTTHGSSCIGIPLNECGFLYMQNHELYAFYAPDVESYVASYEINGYTIENGADKFKMSVDGVEEITKARWNLLVAECKVKEEGESK